MTRLMHDDFDRQMMARCSWWRAAREDVLARDRYRCQAPGEHAGPVSVHHIVPLRHGGSWDDPSNLVTVCRRHHEQLEKRTRDGELAVHLPDMAGERYRIVRVAQRQGLTPLQWVTGVLADALEREWPTIVAEDAESYAQATEVIRPGMGFEELFEVFLEHSHVRVEV